VCSREYGRSWKSPLPNPPPRQRRREQEAAAGEGTRSGSERGSESRSFV
jgi:hypothetical protein